MEPIVTVDTGALRGVSVGRVKHFLGVPYGRASRFSEPQPPQAWSGVRDATEHGPICPQPPSPLERVMGPAPRAPVQDESCLTLSVATLGTDDRHRPVMVWLHGGAYVVGSGSSDWYHPGSLVGEGDVVVVRANYRLGVFGYLRMPGTSPANLGVMDQIAALRWVQRNIAAFGGDPARITVFGESAGAHSAATLMSTAETRGLFQRAILQSGHLGVGFTTQATATRVAALFEEALGEVDSRTASVSQLLAAQHEVVVRMSRPAGMNPTPAFGPIAGEVPIEHATRLLDSPPRFHPGTHLLIGTTREEMRAFFDSNPAIARLRRVPGFGKRAFDALTARVTRRIFGAPAAQLADAQAQAGADVYRYRFDWSPPQGGFGACQYDRPALRARGSRSLGRLPDARIDAVGDDRCPRPADAARMDSFAHHGNPSHEGTESWPRHRPGDGVGRVFA